ncbi:hypothetical protein XarbCFBP8152_10690 [Xanthomonas arboricola]|nr:hypothetical protein XarbCFBP8152_14500 [Xanthomonas arboricola]PPT79213.1 hypothetical protein XarbCFBP8152_10690 [Xanthomonas arboricola]
MCGVDRQRGAASGVGTRRESVRGGSVAASMPPHGPAPGRDTTLPILLALIGKQCFQSTCGCLCSLWPMQIGEPSISCYIASGGDTSKALGISFRNR